jgi:hypothetical protein
VSRAWLATLVATVLGCAVTFAAYRFFRSVKSVLVVPVSWLLGAFIGLFVAVYLKDLPPESGQPEYSFTILDLFWIQKLLILLAPLCVPLVDRVMARGRMRRN